MPTKRTLRRSIDFRYEKNSPYHFLKLLFQKLDHVLPADNRLIILTLDSMSINEMRVTGFNFLLDEIKAAFPRFEICHVVPILEQLKRNDPKQFLSRFGENTSGHMNLTGNAFIATMLEKVILKKISTGK